MNIVSTVNNVLAQLRPFMLMVALLFGFAAAWGGLAEWFPVLKEIWAGKGSPQASAIIGACLAIIAGGAPPVGKS
jgi:hypothetical protein